MNATMPGAGARSRIRGIGPGLDRERQPYSELYRADKWSRRPGNLYGSATAATEATALVLEPQWTRVHKTSVTADGVL
jgi:hypothetical protein